MPNHNKCADCDQAALVGLSSGLWVCLAHFETRLDNLVSKVRRASEKANA